VSPTEVALIFDQWKGKPPRTSYGARDSFLTS
jgi:hypothetical protein